MSKSASSKAASLTRKEIEALAKSIIDENDHYAALGLRRDCSGEALRKAYRLAIKRYHPLSYQDRELDGALKYQLSQAFQRAQQAFSTLSSSSRRRTYDNMLDVRAKIELSSRRLRDVQSAMTQMETTPASPPEVSRPQPAPGARAASPEPKAGVKNSERRRAQRLALRIPIVVSLGYKWQEVTETRDVSQLAVRICLSRSVEPGTLLRLELGLPRQLRTRNYEDSLYIVYGYVLYATHQKGERVAVVEFV